jgi:hypothetical protein
MRNTNIFLGRPEKIYISVLFYLDSEGKSPRPSRNDDITIRLH